MKKLALVFTLLLFTSYANAGSCPMLWGKIHSKMTEIQKLRIDLGLLAGIIEKSSECPSSYGSYQCYYSSTYNNRAD